MAALESNDVKQIVGVVALLAALLFLPKLCSSDSGRQTPTRRQTHSLPSSQQASPSQSQKWYEGGTLHKATMGEWYGATHRNRLATCADFVASMMQAQGQTPHDMDQLRELAAALEMCISEAGDDQQLHGQSAAELASACWILMDH